MGKGRNSHMVNEPLNIKMTLDGLNFVLKHLGELPTNSGAHPLWIELQNQGRAEVERINAPKPVETEPKAA